MKRVLRSEIVDYQTYEDIRSVFREQVLVEKAQRRVAVPPCFTFLFENALTLRYQVQEMMRIERIVREADIQHEIDTYNEVLGEDGELGCTLLVEIDDPDVRDARLTEWLDLPARIYVELADGTRVSAIYDDRQVGETRLSSVQYLRFAVHGQAPVAVGIDDLEGARVDLTESQRSALQADLSA